MSSTRRQFLSNITSPITPSPAPDTPHNNVAVKGNEFTAEYKVWADAFNATPPNGISLPAVNSFERMKKLFRKLERNWSAYIKITAHLP